MTGALPVLVLTNEKDFAADRVIMSLTETHGVSVVRWNAEDLGQQARPWSLEADGEGAQRFRSIWLRQYVRDPPMTTSVADVDEALVLAAQWRAWLPTLDDGVTGWINPLWASRRTESKIVQLRAAREAGLPVPPTTVTSSRDAAAEFLRHHGEAVVKTLSAAYFAHSDQSFVFTEPLEDGLLTEAAPWRSQPLLVQQRIRGRAEVRAVVVDDSVFAAELRRDDETASAADNSPVDWRLQPDRHWTPITLPEHEAHHYQSLVAGLGLRYGAIDLIDDGTTRWFLELNQAGEFAFIDRSADLGIAQALARALAGPP